MIKKTAISALLIISGLCTHTLKAQNITDILQLTLDDALNIALSENLTIQVADREIHKQEYAKKGTYAALFPQIDLSGNYQRTIDKQKMYMDTQNGSTEGISVGRDNTWSGGVTASMPLVSPTLWKSIKISSYSVELAVEKARSSRIELVDQVKQAYYAVLLANDSYSVYKDAYDNAVQNHSDISRKFDEGVASEYDVIRANVSVKNAEPNVFEAENYLILTHWQLKALIGLDLESDIQCVGSLSDFEGDLQLITHFDDAFISNNSELKQLDIRIAEQEATVEMQKSQYLPSLNAHFSYQMTSTNNDFKLGQYQWDPYSYVGVSLSIPIFSGGKRRSDVKQAQITQQQLSMERTDIERNLQVSLKNASDQMQTSIRQYYSAVAGVAESEKGYEITMARYESGEGTMLDINDSQLSMTQARLNLNQAIFNFLVAKSNMEKTLGNNIDETN